MKGITLKWQNFQAVPTFAFRYRDCRSQCYICKRLWKDIVHGLVHKVQVADPNDGCSSISTNDRYVCDLCLPRVANLVTKSQQKHDNV